MRTADLHRVLGHYVRQVPKDSGLAEPQVQIPSQAVQVLRFFSIQRLRELILSLQAWGFQLRLIRILPPPLLTQPQMAPTLYSPVWPIWPLVKAAV